MRRAIESVDDFKAGYLQLMEDFMFDRIPSDVRVKLVNVGLNIGSDHAQKVVQQSKSRDPLFIARQLGAEVNWTSEDNVIGTLLICSEYYPVTIRIYERSINQLKTSVAKFELQDLFPPEKIESFYIAHELFHHLEKTRIGVLSEQYLVETQRLGPIRLKSRIRALSEIGAHAFSKNLLGAKISPKLLNYLFSADKVEEFLSRLKTLETETATFFTHSP
jgi:hypothetical protein